MVFLICTAYAEDGWMGWGGEGLIGSCMICEGCEGVEMVWWKRGNYPNPLAGVDVLH